MGEQRKYPGTPNYHIASARKAPLGAHSVPRKPVLRKDAIEEASRVGFRSGFAVGLVVSMLVMCAILWLWVIPTMDGAVEMAQRAVSA